MAYVPRCQGQIVCIRLKNFMTYTDVVLRPGFQLNLLIGPNGSGKSTFVCAVVLGLGGRMKIVNRADKLSGYIKSGCKEGSIEIELYEPNGNLIIKRKIYYDNHSEFYINGKVASKSKIDDIREKYKIPIDNLCAFLPQEKVHDFSTLNPQELFDQTLKSAGCYDLVSYYDQLKILQTRLAEKKKEITKLEKKIEVNKQENEKLEDKIKNYSDKNSLHDKFVLISQKKAWVCYKNELQKSQMIVDDFRQLEELYKKKKREHKEIGKNIMDAEAEMKNFNDNYLKAKSDETSAKVTVKEEQEKVRKLVENLENIKNAVQLKLAEENNKKSDLKQYLLTLDKLKNDLKFFESKHGTDEDLKSKVDEINNELSVRYQNELKLTEEKNSYEDEEEILRKEMRDVNIEYKILENQKNFRLEFLKQHEPDVFQSMEWLKDRRHIFKGQIYNPILLEMDVTDVSKAKYVEARIGYNDLISFICTDPVDLNLLIRKLRKKKKLKINAICFNDVGNTQYEPDISLKRLRSLGFYAYMKDIIRGPDHIMRYLCKMYKIHCIPIGDESVKTNCDKVPNSIPIFFSEDHMFMVKISVYSGAKSITVRQLNDPTLFVHALNKDRMLQLQEREAQLQEAIQKKLIEIERTKNELSALSEKLSGIREQKRNLAVLQEEKKQILLKLQRAEQNINAIEKSLKDPEQIIEEANAKQKLVANKIQLALKELKEICKKFLKSSLARQEREIAFNIYRRKLNHMSHKKDKVSESLKKLEASFNNLKAVKEKSEAKCLKLKEEAKALTNGISMEDKEFRVFEKKFKALKDTEDELDTELQETRVMADFVDLHTKVYEEYEQRKMEINKAELEMKNLTRDWQKMNEEVSVLKSKWLDPVKDLVAKINESFGRCFETMKCVGEVSLVAEGSEDEFDQYGIIIRTKFRNDVPMQKLGRHFQSGGERAVATGVYLLSLQELTTVPFRFVDEINQGMDSANERRILELMISVTSSEKSTQYFFVTPKLLPDVECSDTMVVHCIHNGWGVFASSENWNLEKFTKRQKRKRKSGVTGT